MFLSTDFLVEYCVKLIAMEHYGIRFTFTFQQGYFPVVCPDM